MRKSHYKVVLDVFVEGIFPYAHDDDVMDEIAEQIVSLNFADPIVDVSVESIECTDSR
jgi:hypothetical protein